MPQSGDTVIFPAGLSAAQKPPAVVVNNVFQFPNATNYPRGSNSTIDANYVINDLIVEDDNYHIDVIPGNNFTLTILGRIVSNFSQTLGAQTGLSLIGPTSGASTLTLLLDKANPNVGGTTLFQADGTGILYINANISQTGLITSIQKTGTGTIALAGNNTFTAGVAVTAGTLVAASDNALGDTGQGTTVANGATLAVSNYAGFTTINESLTLTGDGVGGLGALRGIEDQYYIFRFGTGRAWGTDVTWTGGITLSPSASVGTDSNAPGGALLTIAGTGISGSGNLTKVGDGTVTLTVPNTYAGQTLVRRGELEITDNLALSPTGVVTAPGTVNGSSTTVFAGAMLTFTGNLTINETLFLNGDGLFDNVTRPFGALFVNGISTYTGALTLQSDSSIGVFTAGLLRLNGLMYGGFDLSKVGEGNTRIASANPNFSGDVFVRNGTFEVAHVGALGAGGNTIAVTSTTGIAASQGTLQLEGTYALRQRLALNGTGFQNTGAVHVVVPGSIITMPLGTSLDGPMSIAIDSGTQFDFTGVVSGPLAASFTKTGTGIVSLQASNTYLGTTTFRDGLNVITNSRALGGAGGGDTTVFAGATLQLVNSLTVAGENLNIAGTGTAGQGALVSTGGNTVWSGLVNLLGIQSTRADFSVLSGSLEFSNVISGDADIHKLGAGELRFTGSAANTYTTATFVDAGTLSLGKVPPSPSPTPLNAVGGQVFVGVGTGPGNNSAVLRLLAANQIPESVSGVPITVTVNETGLFDMNGFGETVGPLVLIGGELTTGGAVLTLTTDVEARASAEPARITGTVSLNGQTRTFFSRSSPALSFSVSASPAQFGVPVTFTVTLTIVGPAPTGTVSFFDGNTLLGSANVIAGTAIFTTAALSAGSHDITAVYNGDNNYSPRPITLPAPLLVVGAPSRQILTSSANQTPPGFVPFRFSVARSATTNPIPTGTVTILANGVPVGFDVLDGTGVVTVNTFINTPGAYVITAQYSGDQFYAASVVTLLGGQIVVDAPAMLLTSSANGSAVGQSVTFTYTATASGTSPTPTGTVSFFDGATQIGAAIPLTNGVAVSNAITTLAAGTRVITARYSGDTLYEPQTVTLLGGQIVTNAPVLLLSSDANPALVGQTVTFTFRVNSATASGDVTFFANGIPIGAAVPVINGVATIQTTFSTTGSRAITASYTGGGGSAGGPATLAPIQVVAAPLNIQLTSSTNPGNLSVTPPSIVFTFSAGLPAGGPVPTGTVTFFNGTTQIGTAQTLAFDFISQTFRAQVPTTTLPFGPQFITAVYSGDANYAATTVTLRPQETVTNPPTVQLSASTTTVEAGQPVGFTFTSTRALVANPHPTGTVTFFANGVQIGTPQTLTNGSVNFPWTFGTPGTYVITAVYSGDSFYEPQTVTLLPSLTVVAVNNLPAPPTSTLPAVNTVLEMTGVIAGTGAGEGIIKAGIGAMVLSGANTYTGSTVIDNGALRLGGNETLPNGTDVVLTNVFSVLDANGFVDTVGSLSGVGTLALGAGNITTGANGTSTTFSGLITGTGVLGKVGAGTLTLTGASPGYTGTTIVAAGTVFVNANQNGANVVVQPGATLAGSGQVNAVTVNPGGILSPGATAGATGILTGAGNLTLSSGSAFVVQANSTTAGSGYDRFVTTGTVNLGGATLSLALGFTPNLNDTLTLITAGTVTGTFAGLADGGLIVQNGRVLRINYTGTAVTLTTVAIAATGGITSSSNPSLPGAPVTFTFTLTPTNAGDPRPTGNILFYIDGVLVATQPLAGGATGPGTVSITTGSGGVPVLTAGSHTVTVTYAGDANYQAIASGAVSLVQRATFVSTTTLTPQNGPSVFGDPVSFLAAVAQVSGQAVPTGTVTFVNAATGAVLGTATLDATGRAVFSTASLPPGTVTVRADYSGDSNYRSSSATATQVVDRQNRVVVGSDAGPVATVQVFDSRTGALLNTFQPFDQYTGGVKVATGDVNGDGIADIVVSAGAGAPGGHVKVYDGATFGLLSSFFTFIGFNGGVNIAVGDVNGDGFGDVVIGTAVANDHVKAFSGRSLLNGGIAADGTADPSTILSFFAYGGGNPVGVTVAAGDVDGDGRADVITGSATFAGHVKAFSASGQQIGSYFAYGAGYLGGIYVAAGDLNGDGRAEIITGATNAPHVKALRLDGSEVASFFAFLNDDGSPVPFGVRVGAADRTGDRLADILVGAGSSAPAVKVFSGLDPSQLIESFLANPQGQPPSSSGVFVGGSGPK